MAHTSTTGASKMSLPQLRHDVRNHLNAIKISCALLHRPPAGLSASEMLAGIEQCADGIESLVARFLGDADAPSLLQPPRRPPHRRR